MLHVTKQQEERGRAQLIGHSIFLEEALWTKEFQILKQQVCNVEFFLFQNLRRSTYYLVSEFTHVRQ